MGNVKFDEKELFVLTQWDVGEIFLFGELDMAKAYAKLNLNIPENAWEEMDSELVFDGEVSIKPIRKIVEF